jgi:hypothetical protein
VNKDKVFVLIVIVVIPLLVFVSSCCKHEPKRYEVYVSSFTGLRVQLAYVGRNWEIQEAVARKELNDNPAFHSEEFWEHPNSLNLAVLEYRKEKVYTYGEEPEYCFKVISMEQFTNEYKCVEK